MARPRSVSVRLCACAGCEGVKAEGVNGAAKSTARVLPRLDRVFWWENVYFASLMSSASTNIAITTVALSAIGALLLLRHFSRIAAPTSTCDNVFVRRIDTRVAM